MTKPVLDQVNIVCGDMDASLSFYRRLGVDIPENNVWRTDTGAHHIGASGNDTQLDLDSTAFATHWNAAWKGRADLKGRVVVGFSVDTREDVDTLYRDMTGAGHRGLQEPWDAFWGARYAIIEDPNGVAVGIMSPISMDRKYPPPEV